MQVAAQQISLVDHGDVEDQTLGGRPPSAVARCQPAEQTRLTSLDPVAQRGLLGRSTRGVVEQYFVCRLDVGAEPGARVALRQLVEDARQLRRPSRSISTRPRRGGHDWLASTFDRMV
jgi:hypothetical protein